MPMPPGRRHAVLERAQEVLVEAHRLDVARARRAAPARRSARAARPGRRARSSRSRARSRARRGPTSRPRRASSGAPRTSGDVSTGKSMTKVGRIERALHEVLPELLDELAVGLLRDRDADVARPCACSSPKGVSGVMRVRGRLGQRLVHRDAVPLATEVVLGAVGPGDRRGSGDRDRGVLDQLLREVGDLVVVAVGLVGLDHRELGRVRRVGALVAEVAVDLEDALDAADGGALEEELGRDAQVELGVEGVASA